MVRSRFVVPVSALACAFVVPIAAAIAFSLADATHEQRLVRVEMRGAACFPTVYQSLLAVEAYRARPSAPLAAAVERDFAHVRSSDCLIDSRGWSQIEGSWLQAERDAGKLPALEDQVVEYLQIASEETNLSYDASRAVTDLDDAVAYRLPGASTRFSLAAATNDPIAAARLAAAGEDRLHFGFSDLAAAVDEYPAYGANLGARLRRAESSTHAYLVVLGGWERAAARGRHKASAARGAAMRKAVSQLDRLFFVGTDELRNTLAQKLDRLERRRRTILGMAAAVFTLTIGIVLAIAAMIARRDRSELSQAEAKAALLQAELARKGAEEALRLNEVRFRTIFAASPLPMAITDMRGMVTQCNAAYRHLVGTGGEPTGRRLLDPLAIDPPAELESMFEALRTGQTDVRTTDFHAYDGRIRTWYHAIVSSVPDAGGAPSYCTVMLQDITERMNRERQLHHEATHDTMTGLPNRAYLTSALEYALNHGEGQPRFALFFIDVDDFKAVNDTLGHAAGDDYLRFIARRLSACVRPGDVVARYGGDEFAVLLESPPNASDVDKIVARIGAEFSEPVALAGTSLTVGLSIGIVVDDGEYGTSASALADADLAMYRAKAGGGNRWVSFRRSPEHGSNAGELHPHDSPREPEGTESEPDAAAASSAASPCAPAMAPVLQG